LRISAAKTEEVTGQTKVHDEELHNLYSSNTVRVLVWSGMRWVVHVAHMRKEEMHTEFWSRCLKGRGHIGDLGEYWMIILKWMLGNRILLSSQEKLIPSRKLVELKEFATLQ
jgi:hypothetical protein